MVEGCICKECGKLSEFLEKQLRKCNAEVNDPGEPCVLFSRENENNLQAHICRTEGLLHFFFQWGDVCRDEKVFGSILDRMKMISASIMEFLGIYSNNSFSRSYNRCVEQMCREVF